VEDVCYTLCEDCAARLKFENYVTMALEDAVVMRYNSKQLTTKAEEMFKLLMEEETLASKKKTGPRKAEKKKTKSLKSKHQVRPSHHHHHHVRDMEEEHKDPEDPQEETKEHLKENAKEDDNAANSWDAYDNYGDNEGWIVVIERSKIKKKEGSKPTHQPNRKKITNVKLKQPKVSQPSRSLSSPCSSPSSLSPSSTIKAAISFHISKPAWSLHKITEKKDEGEDEGENVTDYGDTDVSVQQATEESKDVMESAYDVIKAMSDATQHDKVMKALSLIIASAKDLMGWCPASEVQCCDFSGSGYTNLKCCFD